VLAVSAPISSSSASSTASSSIQRSPGMSTADELAPAQSRSARDAIIQVRNCAIRWSQHYAGGCVRCSANSCTIASSATAALLQGERAQCSTMSAASKRTC
jgi:hypothetical protein